MEREGAEIHELKPRDKEGRPTLIEDRWPRFDHGSPREAAERQHRRAMKRILEVEAGFSLPALEHAALEAERGRRLHAMAGLAGDSEHEQKLGAALRRLAAAAGLSE